MSERHAIVVRRLPRVPVVLRLVTGLLLVVAVAAAPAVAAPACPAERPEQLKPTDPELCKSLLPAVQTPGSPEHLADLAGYQEKLGDFLRNFCHRDAAKGWKRDKTVRDTGPFTATLGDGKWSGAYHGTHAPVVVWYSPEMMDWLHANRPEGKPAPATAAPIPDGAIIVKEMFPAPAAACAGVDPLKLLPTSGAAVMVRDARASQDGWYWAWFGWSGWTPDYPPDSTNRYPFQGFGQYCLNCHTSARDNHTFASLNNVEGEPGDPLVFLSQHFFEPQPVAAHHRLVALPTDDAPRLGQPHYLYNRAVVDAIPAHGLPRPSWETVVGLPSQTYDEVWVEAGTVTARSQFVTSSQCLGCHDAGGTGLQFDMTAPNPHGDNLLNLSPYATWRTSPMGLGGRDPVFYAQLQSELNFHPAAAETLQGVCMGCHGVAGQRQFEIDRGGDDGECPPFLREYASAVPWPPGNPSASLARYGALARDGISCPACHHMLAGAGPENPAIREPENNCVKERQDFLNPHNKGFAKTFTGSFLVGPPDRLFGQFPEPKVKPMEGALGITPVHDTGIQSSELCGSCHTVHLPVMVKGKVVAHVYEQGTYPEWAFSAYRTGDSPQGKLPGGAGPKAQSCQGCHMPSKDAKGQPYRSKIAGIQEHTNFPQAEHALGGDDIDLMVREGFARHTLVGLNVFFVKMAQQFPDVLGIRTQDPMLVSKGLDPLLFTEQAMLDQASHSTAKLAIPRVEVRGGKLAATVRLDSDVGHKMPSGVGFRRVFLELDVLDANGNVLWASGRTNDAGVIVDEHGKPVAGELWWKDDCSGLLNPDRLVYQKHHQVIRRQDEAQIYQELVSAPPPGDDDPTCGLDVPPRPPLTTSFLSICGRVKDNRILPAGFLGRPERVKIAQALGAGIDLARDVEPFGIGDDPDYVQGGGDSLVYEIDLSDVKGTPASVQATLFYQAIPPFYLQDRFCTSKSVDTQRLYFLAGHLNLGGTAAESWKLEIVSTEPVAVPARTATTTKGR